MLENAYGKTTIPGRPSCPPPWIQRRKHAVRLGSSRSSASRHVSSPSSTGPRPGSWSCKLQWTRRPIFPSLCKADSGLPAAASSPPSEASSTPLRTKLLIRANHPDGVGRVETYRRPRTWWRRTGSPAEAISDPAAGSWREFIRASSPRPHPHLTDRDSRGHSRDISDAGLLRRPHPSFLSRRPRVPGRLLSDRAEVFRKRGIGSEKF